MNDSRTEEREIDLEVRLAGVLLGTALGDALGIPMEGMTPRAIARRFGRPDRFHLFGRRGFVSDDTEQSALVAQSLILHSADAEACAASFRKSLVGWFFRLPWGIGLGTLRSCLRAAAGLKNSGVPSAGNGAAMRSAITGAFFADDLASRREFAAAIARVTHTHELAVSGAVYVAEVAALAASGSCPSPYECGKLALDCVHADPLRQSIETALKLANDGGHVETAALQLKTSGYVLHTVPFAAFCFARFGSDPLEAIQEAIMAGGDTDTTAAIVAAWCGASHGAEKLPASLVSGIHDGPFGPSHLRALAHSLALVSQGQKSQVPRFSRIMAMVRNIGLYPVILAHGFRRLVPL